MGAIFAFKCTACYKVHEGSPSFSYDAPVHYSELSDDEKAKAQLDSDTCVITHDEGVDRFVRVVLEVPIAGVSQPFTWGVWVSLSQASFERYLGTWDDPDESDSYFGWLCNRLPFYPDTNGLMTMVRPRKHGLRPYLELKPDSHLLAMHQHEGISVQLAQEIAECAIHSNHPRRTVDLSQ